jgi:uncharacterized membrane protein
MITGMTTGDISQAQRINWLYRISRLIGLMVLFTLAIPLLLGILFSVPITHVLALVTATLVFQAAAVLIGVGLQVDPVLLLVIVTSVAIGVIMGIMEICDLFSDSSERVAGWLRSVEGHIERFRFLHYYGALMLIPIIWIPGIALYGTPLIAWIFQWNRLASLLCMVVGWLMASVFVLLISLGLTTII